MTEFYFVRHGQTQVNLRNAFNGGSVDEPLTESGVQAAKDCGAALSNVHFVQAISSDMPRAITTSRLILKANHYPTPLSSARGLHEMDLGDWDGKTVEEVADPVALDVYFHDLVRFDQDFATDRHIEGYANTLRRAKAVIAATYAAHPSGKVLVVAHGIVFQLLLNTLIGVPFDELRKPKMLRNATISQLNTQDGVHFSKILWDMRPDEIENKKILLT
ncbi:histidine phosphatase family protein [Lacticaseibacillus porcinae]|uniref:histidine phosphatase family protein n=1 Tax=Lacticaseibacillus porcinae TaxID=1123687 RepID=UPI0013DDBE8A|nr:histidine phosphatase family protein [Lacticaseibacillus porcinae]